MEKVKQQVHLPCLLYRGHDEWAVVTASAQSGSCLAARLPGHLFPWAKRLPGEAGRGELHQDIRSPLSAWCELLQGQLILKPEIGCPALCPSIPSVYCAPGTGRYLGLSPESDQ